MVLPLLPFGNIEWWSLALQCEPIQLNYFENYQKQTWRNRYDILGANGVQKLTIPVSRPSGVKIKTAEVQIFNEENWRNIHWRSIKSAYGSSPFWIYYSDPLEELFHKPHESLAEFCRASIGYVLEELQLENSLLEVNSDIDLQNFKHLDFKPSKSVFESKSYLQVFADRFEFQQNLSILDVMFNLGPESEEYVRHCYAK